MPFPSLPCQPLQLATFLMLCCHLDVESSTVHACPLLSIWIYEGYKFGGSCYCNSKFLETQELRPMIKNSRVHTWACHCLPCLWKSCTQRPLGKGCMQGLPLFACWQLLFLTFADSRLKLSYSTGQPVGSGDAAGAAEAWSWNQEFSASSQLLVEWFVWKPNQPERETVARLSRDATFHYGEQAAKNNLKGRLHLESPSPGVYRLFIQNVAVQDSGTYSCRGRSGCPVPVARGTNRLRTPLARWLFASLTRWELTSQASSPLWFPSVIVMRLHKINFKMNPLLIKLIQLISYLQS